MAGAGAVMAFARFADWSKFLPRTNAALPAGTPAEQAADKTAIRPFRVNVPEAELAELRKRIIATRWPER
ncbi:MAG TPA: hypothetical protein VHK86_03130, partial [Nitrososphaera sp.]|nr:hypothetical protein [Nitrososphaera sp.]